MYIVTKNILSLLNEKGISANKLSLECGLNNSAISEWKKGKSNPSSKALDKIAKYFDLPLSYFYEEHQETDTPTTPDITHLHLSPELQAGRIAFGEGLEGLTQEDIDAVTQIIRSLKEKNKKNDTP